MKIQKKSGFFKAFTIVEVMVAMVVLAIGLLGMAGMTLMVLKGGSDASRLTYATNLASDKMEALKDVDWADLGNTSTCTAGQSGTFDLVNGCDSHIIVYEQGLNQQGQTEAVGGTAGAPYPFTRSWVVCHEDDDLAGLFSDTTVSSTDHCSLGATVEELTCNDGTTEVNANEKKIKIVVSWRDKSGRCHKVDMTSIQVNL